MPNGHKQFQWHDTKTSMDFLTFFFVLQTLTVKLVLINFGLSEKQWTKKCIVPNYRVLVWQPLYLNRIYHTLSSDYCSNTQSPVPHNVLALQWCSVIKRSKSFVFVCAFACACMCVCVCTCSVSFKPQVFLQIPQFSSLWLLLLHFLD